MARYRIQAVLWRKANQATVDTLRGDSDGQYDIRLGSSAEISSFFTGLSQTLPTAQGGFTLKVPIAPFDGAGQVPANVLDVRYMGASSVRKDWNIPSQRPETAYPLWRMGRGLPKGQTTAIDAYVCLIRDVDNRYHARFLTKNAIGELPAVLRAAISSKEVGVWTAPSTGGVAMAQPTISSGASEVRAALLEHYNVLIYGPPGTGKTRLVQEVMTSFGDSGFQVDTAEEHKPISTGSSALSAFVTFHQSYSYEEFVVGLRTNPNTEKLIDLQPVAGILLELAENARKSGQSSLLVIDEINRGNVSRIFGEFITLLEPDKRLGSDGKTTSSTIKIRLPYARPDQPLVIGVGENSVNLPQPFTMPLRVYTLATMNSVDKSVAPLDAALRRRFHVIHLEPNLDSMAALLGVAPVGEVEIALPATELSDADVKRLGLVLLRRLNEGISSFRGPEYRLGHWYLRDLSGAKSPIDAEARLCRIWRHQLFPQLEELFHGRIEQLRILLEPSTKRADAPYQLREPEAAYTDAGGVPWVQTLPGSDKALMLFLRAIAGVKVLSGG